MYFPLVLYFAAIVITFCASIQFRVIITLYDVTLLLRKDHALTGDKITWKVGLGYLKLLLHKV